MDQAYQEAKNEEDIFGYAFNEYENEVKEALERLRRRLHQIIEEEYLKGYRAGILDKKET